MTAFGPTRDQNGNTVYGGRVGGEPCASWFCPQCGKAWISATGGYGKKHWTCSRCGHNTREVQAERDRALRRARENKNVYRYKDDVDLLAQLLQLRAQGLSQREVARRLGVSNTTVGRMERRA